VCKTASARLYGPIQTGSVGPNTLTTGRSSATARCIGPESLVMQIAERWISAASSLSAVIPARSIAPGAKAANSLQTTRSRCEPIKITAKPLDKKCPATFANLSLPQCFVSQIVPGAMMTTLARLAPCRVSNFSTREIAD